MLIPPREIALSLGCRLAGKAPLCGCRRERGQPVPLALRPNGQVKSLDLPRPQTCLWKGEHPSTQDPMQRQAWGAGAVGGGGAGAVNDLTLKDLASGNFGSRSPPYGALSRHPRGPASCSLGRPSAGCYLHSGPGPSHPGPPPCRSRLIGRLAGEG